jgi:hypothetical protein
MLDSIRQRCESPTVKKCTDAIRLLSPAAVILGVVLNTLEACKLSSRADTRQVLTTIVSLGILIFPHGDHYDAFAGLQVQAISLFIMRYRFLHTFTATTDGL